MLALNVNHKFCSQNFCYRILHKSNRRYVRKIFYDS